MARRATTRIDGLPRLPHPIDSVEWVDPATLYANNWNPNTVFPPELALLKLSILADGWTQPIVAAEDGRIIDGFHRWNLGRNDEEIRAVSGGLVPVVRRPGASRADAIASTVRHNRARGQHGIVAMGHLVRELLAEGMSAAEVGHRLGMEEEEVERLSDFRSSPERAGQESFGKGWVPKAD